MRTYLSQVASDAQMQHRTVLVRWTVGKPLTRWNSPMDGEAVPVPGRPHVTGNIPLYQRYLEVR